MIEHFTIGADATVYGGFAEPDKHYSCKMYAQKQNISLFLLLPGQAWFLCRDSAYYYRGQCSKSIWGRTNDAII